MKTKEEDNERFKSLLDSRHQWPGEYLFKFIVTQDTLSLASALFSGYQVSYRQSAQGKYIAISFTLMMNSSDEVLAIYKKAKAVPGLIAL